MQDFSDILDYVGNLTDCPWSNWRPSELHFCEALRCERIVAPAETWSNIGFILIGLYLIFRSREKNLRSIEMRYGLYAFIVGICSTLFHASHTYVFETLDLASMLLLGTELIVANLIRLGWLRGASPVPFASLLFFGGVGMLFGLAGTARLGVFGGFVTTAVFFEMLIFVRAQRIAGGIITAELKQRYRPFLVTLGLFLISYAAWTLDFRRIYCHPDQHFLSGHAVWHLLNSACFLTLSRFYRGVFPLAPTGLAR